MKIADKLVGNWICILEESDEVGRFGSARLEIEIDEQALVLKRHATGARIIDVISCPLDGSKLSEFPPQRVIPDLFTSGIYRSIEDQRQVYGEFKEEAATIHEELVITASQGKKPAQFTYDLELFEDENKLRLTFTRSTIPEHTGTTYLFARSGESYAYAMELGDNWEVSGDLSKHAMLISIQAIANAKKPQLYFVYPDNWDFKFTPSVRDYLQKEKAFHFQKLHAPEIALNVFSRMASGYVIWDKSVRTSLIAAYTIGGVENAIVVSEDEVPLVEAVNLPLIVDLRNQFVGKTDAEIYRWTYDRYWSRCNRDYIVWLGGEHGNIMRPGVADWGMYKKAFFTDLSTRKTDVEEHELSTKLLSEQNPGSYVFGWHSYKKDTEEEHVSLTSSFGLRVEGLHTLPNMSFSSQIPVSDGFEFNNNHNVDASYTRKPEKEIYLACVQTDCLGIGAWTEPGRGEIPYAWEVTMNWVWLAPAMMEFFYSQATEKDYFIGALSGPGYMYPASIPTEILPGLIGEASELMKQLDLKVFDIMDFTRIARPEGGTPDLDKDTVEAYYSGMPDAIGFVNGYYPAQTYTVRGEKPFFSFDYYLSPTRSKADAVQDLLELANVNSKRPYFLLVHVRNFSNLGRVIDIVRELPDEFEITPLDEFLVMAGRNWNFAELYATDA